MSETLYSLLQTTAGEHAARVAVSLQGRSTTYAELLDATDRLAGHLGDRGVGPGTRVAHSFRKSVDALTAIFAANRVGATYVPLDPTWPAERVTAICRDAGIDTWLGSKPPSIPGMALAFVSSVNSAGDASGAEIVPLAEASRRPPLTVAAAAPAEDIANVLYTSGSTGQPKGVLITTKSLLHFSRWAAETFELGPDDRVANHAPYHFDLSTFDIFAAVRCGAAMCPVPERTRMLPYPLARFIASERISIWYSVPSALTMLENQWRGNDELDFSALRHVIFAGEVMPKPALQLLADRLPHVVFTNLFGPTETNVCTWHRVAQGDLGCSDPLPIGKPIADTRVWLVDESGRPADSGEGGELLVAGPTVTPGYLGDAALTAQRLIPAPDGAGWAYRTGDWASWGAGGALTFHGRRDRMMKIRGYRIEPGEIEAALCGHVEVREAAVLAAADPGGNGQRISAFISLLPGAEPDVAELTAHCRGRLPSYMVPEIWRFVDHLPRTDRGKVDLQLLQATDDDR